MQPISSLTFSAAQSSASAAGVKEPPKVRRPEDESQRHSLKPTMDEFVPEEKQEPSGLYRPVKDEDGKPMIFFDAPEQAEDANQKLKDVSDTGISDQDKGTVNTGKVDREIEKLKKRKQELQQRLNTETDSVKIKDLESELTRIENELRQKDNDTYRRQNAAYTCS